jgi:hypothetical protein
MKAAADELAAESFITIERVLKGDAAMNVDNMFAQHTRSSSEASHELAAQLCTDACS